MTKTLRVLSGVALVAVLAFLLNPSAERHRERIKASTAERSPLAHVLGVGALTAFASNYRSLGVASTMQIDDRTVSVGAFGMVWVME